MEDSGLSITAPFADAVAEIGHKYGFTSKDAVTWKAFCLMVEFQGNNIAALKKAEQQVAFAIKGRDQEEKEKVAVFLFEQGSNGRLKAACEEVLKMIPNCPGCGDGPR